MNLAAIAGFAQVAYDLYQQFRPPAAEVPTAIEAVPIPEQFGTWEEASPLILDALNSHNRTLDAVGEAIARLADAVSGLAEAQAEQARHLASVRRTAAWALALAILGAACGGVALVVALR